MACPAKQAATKRRPRPWRRLTNPAQMLNKFSTTGCDVKRIPFWEQRSCRPLRLLPMNPRRTAAPARSRRTHPVPAARSFSCGRTPAAAAGPARRGITSRAPPTFFALSRSATPARQNDGSGSRDDTHRSVRRFTPSAYQPPRRRRYRLGEAPAPPRGRERPMNSRETPAPMPPEPDCPLCGVPVYWVEFLPYGFYLCDRGHRFEFNDARIVRQIARRDRGAAGD